MNKVVLHHFISLFQNYVLRDPHPQRISLEKDKVNTQYCDESYKYEILQNAQESLNKIDWSFCSDEGICRSVVEAVNYSGNLVNSHTRGSFVKAVQDNPKEYADIFRKLYNEGCRDPECFDELCDTFGARYGLIAYLFFIKDSNKYLPITPTVFDRLFRLIGIEYSTAYRCSWKNYIGFLYQIQEIQKEIESTMMCEISLVDAHSFVWILEVLQAIQTGLESSVSESIAHTSSGEEKKINLTAPDYNGTPRAKDSRSKQHASERYTGRQSISRAALKKAKYRCEVNPEHCTFIKKSDGNPYTEAHHLIPLMYSDEFKYSLDNVANIVSLCSKCHNQLHYGEDVATPLRKLYEKRKKELEQAGIGIEFSKLFSYYE